MRATDSFTKEIITKINRLKDFEERYLVALQAAKIAEATGLAPMPGEAKRPRIKYGYKIALRLELAHIRLKKQLRSYKKREGLAPVCLDIFSRDFGKRAQA